MSKMLTLAYPIQFNAGAVLHEGPDKVEYAETPYEVMIPIGKDHVARLIITRDVVEDNPHLFKEA